MMITRPHHRGGSGPQRAHTPEEDAMAKSAAPGKSLVTWGTVTVLLLVAIGGALWVPIYARSMPKLGNFPFFYWYQLIWVPVVAILSWLCFLLLRTKPTADAGSRNSGGMQK
jgi:hypothetical protein